MPEETETETETETEKATVRGRMASSYYFRAWARGRSRPGADPATVVGLWTAVGRRNPLWWPEDCRTLPDASAVLLEEPTGHLWGLVYSGKAGQDLAQRWVRFPAEMGPPPGVLTEFVASHGVVVEVSREPVRVGELRPSVLYESLLFRVDTTAGSSDEDLALSVRDVDGSWRSVPVSRSDFLRAADAVAWSFKTGVGE